MVSSHQTWSKFRPVSTKKVNAKTQTDSNFRCEYSKFMHSCKLKVSKLRKDRRPWTAAEQEQSQGASGSHEHTVVGGEDGVDKSILLRRSSAVVEFLHSYSEPTPLEKRLFGCDSQDLMITREVHLCLRIKIFI